jgi:hypothetical protein
VTRPPPIRTDGSNEFARRTMRSRVPRMIRAIQEQSYPVSVLEALDRLHDEILGDRPFAPIDMPAPDAKGWAVALAERDGETWLNTGWYFAESLLYRSILQATRYFETERDPFAPEKAEELASTALRERLEAALAPPSGDREEHLAGLLHAALWANRLDLSYTEVAGRGDGAHREDLLVDDAATAAARLAAGGPEIHLIADNAGSELCLDLALIDALLAGPVGRVFVHVKMHPTFVSDATVSDVWKTIASLREGGPLLAGLADRLTAAFDERRLGFYPDFFWNSHRFFFEMPGRIEGPLRRAALVICKGDANYRRLLGDALWSVDVPLDHAIGYFPAPLLALRTLKSDSLVGIPLGIARQLDEASPTWRVDGRRGLCQLATPTGLR